MNALTQHNLEMVADATIKSTDKVDIYFVKHVDLEIAVKVVDKDTGMVTAMKSIYSDGVVNPDIELPVSLHLDKGMYELFSVELGTESYDSLEEEGCKNYVDRYFQLRTEATATKLAESWAGDNAVDHESLTEKDLLIATIKEIGEDLKFSDRANELIMSSL